MIAGAKGPLRFISTSSVSHERRASSINLLLKPISVLLPSVEASILSLELPRAVTAEIFIISSSKINLMGLLVFSVIIIEALSIHSISFFVLTLTVADLRRG